MKRSTEGDNGHPAAHGRDGETGRATDRGRAGKPARVWVGVRPEKFSLEGASAPGDPIDLAELNALAGGIVSDVSFVGVSTQYLVRMPWGQELTVFEQNTGERTPFAAGMAVSVRWRPAHVFLLDHEQDALAGQAREGRQWEAGSSDPAKT